MHGRGVLTLAGGLKYEVGYNNDILYLMNLDFIECFLSKFFTITYVCITFLNMQPVYTQSLTGVMNADVNF